MMRFIGIASERSKKMARLKLKTFIGLFCTLGVAAIFLPGSAHAQRAGQIILTQEEIPTEVSPKELAAFFKKFGRTVLEPSAGGTSYQVFMAARLRRRPSAADLKRNEGQVHIAIYERVKRKWQYINVFSVGYTDGLTLIVPLQLTHDMGLKKGSQYQMRLTILDAKQREQVLASTDFRLK